MRMLAGVAVLSALSAGMCAAQQQPKVSEAKVSVVDGPNVQAAIARVDQPTWIGYAIAVTSPVNSDWNESKDYLEGNRPEEDRYERPAGAPQPWANVLLRVAGGRVQRVQLEAPDRELDCGGLSFEWVNDVSAADSVKLLSGIVEAESKLYTANEDGKVVEPRRSQMERAMVAIALEDTPLATPALRGFTAASYPLRIRDRAAFWLANSRGSEGFQVVSSLLKSDKDDVMREKLVFDLTLVRGTSRPAAVDTLLVAAKSDPTPKVRSQAQFWLSQIAGKKAEAAADADPRILKTLGDEAQSDPNASIRKSAVFALSRLPEDQGVPKLIEVANTSQDPATRREAIFWLGRSKDPRALEYLEEIVKQ
jgi:hypothetical protein